MAATAQQAPGVLSFLKHGVTVPVRRYGLFLRALGLNAALATAVLLFEILATPILKPYATAITERDDDGAVDAKAIFFAFLVLVTSGAAYLALCLATELVRTVATASAAVAACSGERHTFGSFLRKVRGNVLAGSATVVSSWAVRAAYASAATAAAVAAPPLIVYYYDFSAGLFQLDALFAALAFQLYFYLGVVCTMAVVVSVAAEPGGRRVGPGAVVRAWRLMRGTGPRALLYVVVTLALNEAVRPVHGLAVTRLLPHGMGDVEVFLVDASVKFVLDFAVEVFCMAAIAAYYFECRKTKEEEKPHHA